MIHVKTIGRFGNCLHQYAYARLLAEETHYALKFHDPNNEYHNIIKDWFPLATDLDGIKKFGSPIRISDGSNGIPINKLARTIVDKDRQVKIRGNCEIYGLLTWKQQQRIKEFMVCRQHLTKNIKDDDIVLHYRTGDLVNYTTLNDGFLSIHYYRQILSTIKFNRLYVVTEKRTFDKDVKKNFLAGFEKFKPIYITNDNLMDDFNFIRLFNKIIISQSSFSWWSALLSEAKEIYYPLPIYGPWSKNPPQRKVPEDRYIYIKEDPLGCIKRHRLIIKSLMGKLKSLGI